MTTSHSDIYSNIQDDIDDNMIDYLHENKCRCKHLKLLQAVAYNYIKKFTKNEHLRFVFAAYAMNPMNRALQLDELLNIFIHKNKLDKIM